MNNNQIIQIIRKSASLLGHDFDGHILDDFRYLNRDYKDDQITDMKRDLIEEGNRVRIIFLDNHLKPEEFESLLNEVEMPLVAFMKREEGIVPIIFCKEKGKRVYLLVKADREFESNAVTSDMFSSLYTNEAGEVVFLGVFSYKSLVSDDPEPGDEVKKFTPFRRLIRLLSEEKKDIFYIYVYAMLIGLISLTLPLGIQATVSLVSGGVFFSSIYILIALVIIGVLATGGLQVMQITLVEYLQRRVFAKAAFEFSFRVPRIKAEALIKHHAPELMNRFFDVLTIQKGLPKILIDLSAAVIQIFFGLLLLSFYHPFFVFFGLVLLGVLALIFYLTGGKGLSTSIKESKFKYKVVHWLEELARTMNSFKLSGNTSLPMSRTDADVNNYLKYRKAHFGVLVEQYLYVIAFKALVIGGLLVIGAMLVVQREITLGQFVAAEVVIILIVGSVEKIIMYMDSVYDILTAVDKISQVTDLPLERSGGYNLPREFTNNGFEINIKDLYCRFQEKEGYVLKGINLKVAQGERICLAGPGGSGKTLLTNIISGLHTEFQGAVTINRFSIRDLDLNNLRDRVGKNVSQEDVFEGTIMENVLLAKPYSKPEDAIWALEQVGIIDEVNVLPEGLATQLVSGGKGLPSSMVKKIILARCLAKHPALLILNDFFSDFRRRERMELMDMLKRPQHKWTMWVVSNDPLIMAACDRVIALDKGKIVADGVFEELIKDEALKNILS